MVDLKGPSALAAALAPHDSEGLQAALLYAAPSGARFALLATRGTVLVAPLDDHGGAGAAPVRVLELHFPMRRSDKDAFVGDMALWRPREGGGCRLVSVGSDGDIAVTALDDGAALVGLGGGGGSFADERWHATARGSGCSAQYAYAPAFRVAVSDAYGVALTGSRESVCHLWNLRSKKSSPAGKLLSVTPKLGGGRASLMCVAASATSGLFAFSCSNNSDEPTLKIVTPVGT